MSKDNNTTAWWVLETCQDCEGTGVVSDRHPNDPSARDTRCRECGGEGIDLFKVTCYDTIEDVLGDYPGALRIEQVME